MYFAVPNISVVVKDILEILGRNLHVNLVAFSVVWHVRNWVNYLTPRTSTFWDALPVFRICAFGTDKIRIVMKEIRGYIVLVVHFSFGDVDGVGVCVRVVVVVIICRDDVVVVRRCGA